MHHGGSVRDGDKPASALGREDVSSVADDHLKKVTVKTLTPLKQSA